MFLSHVECFGHIVGGGERRPSPGKLQSLTKWPRPKTETELRGFLGFCNWYQEYVKDYAKWAGPLQNMLRLKKAEAKKGCTKVLRWSQGADKWFTTL